MQTNPDSTGGLGEFIPHYHRAQLICTARDFSSTHCTWRDWDRGGLGCRPIGVHEVNIGPASRHTLKQLEPGFWDPGDPGFGQKVFRAEPSRMPTGTSCLPNQ